MIERELRMILDTGQGAHSLSARERMALDQITTGLALAVAGVGDGGHWALIAQFADMAEGAGPF